ncbi:MAG: TonB-dependent receptor [Acidobacteria bacterium]|nr:TonB-dependent receptor [Acidobacteriota bacterium]
MKHLKVYRVILLTAVLFVFAATARAQTAQVTGRVSDAGGAVVPGAQISLTNQANGFKRDTVTNEEGYYTIPLLQPGNYEVSVRKDGFKPIIQSGITLQVEQVARLDFNLETGAVTDTVNITSTGPVLERETSSVGQIIENKTIVTLPLNGRNYSQLVALMPGATPNQGSRATDGISLNGNRTFQNTYLIDGVDNNNYILGVDTNSTQALRPSVDAIQEFKVESANYSAEYGRSAGGIISLAIKSGTNEFHGSAFEFLRNDKLDANNWFSNRANLDRPPLRYNQFGGTFGGPIIKNHTFFFASYQGTRDKRARTGTTTVPTAEMIRGNFGSINIFDPANVVSGARAQFANNIIPDARIDPVGRKLAALYPAPNQPGSVNNYVANVPITDYADQLDLRGDHSFRASDTMFVRYSWSDREITQGSFFAAPGNGGNGFGDYPLIQLPQAWSIAGGETHIFSTSLVNELRIGFTRNKSDQLSPASQSLYDQFGIKGVPQFEGLNGLPTFTVTNFASLGDRTFAPNPKRVGVFQLTDNLSWTRGNHGIKFGGDLRLRQNFAGTSNIARSSFTLNGQFTSRVPGTGTGSAVADLLLGLTSSAQLSTRLLGDFRDRYYGFYANDTWRVTPKLTLNLGLRYELQTPMWENDNQIANFDLNPGSSTYGTMVNANDGGIRERSFSNLDKNNFAPRFGFSYAVDQRTVLRGSFGVFYGGLGYQAIAQMGAGNIPYAVNINNVSATTAANSNLILSNGFPANFLDPARAVNPNAIAYPENFPLAEIYQWNLNVQRELWRQMVFSVAYVGSSSAYLRGYNDVNAPPPGAGAINPRRPFPTFGAISYVSPFAHSTYHALQAKAERRFSNGFSLLSAYTWSHVIDNSVDGEDTGNGAVNPQDPRNTNAEKASSSIDLRHRWVTSAIYDLPFGRKGGWLSQNAATRAIFGGWQLGGIFNVQSGFPLSPTVTPNPANTTTTARPNLLRDPNLARGERTVDRWYDPTAFATPTQFNFGNSARNVIRAPGLVNLDLLIARNFQVTERFRIEFRSEMYNTTNSVHFGRPNVQTNAAQAGRITTTQIPNRQVQFGLRLVF